MQLYGFTEKTVLNIRTATFTVEPDTKCLLCSLMKDELGKEATTRRQDRLVELNNDYSHTLGSNCGFRELISDEKLREARQHDEELEWKFFEAHVLTQHLR